MRETGSTQPPAREDIMSTTQVIYFPEYDITAVDHGGVYVDLFAGQVTYDSEIESYVAGTETEVAPYDLLNSWDYAAGAREAGWNVADALAEVIAAEDHERELADSV